MAHGDYQIFATDSLLPRKRLGRMAVFVLWIVITSLLTISFSGKVMSDWFGLWWLGFFIGLAFEVLIITSTLHRFIIQVGAMRAFVTIDQLRTFFGSHTGTEDQKAYVVYGPGVHISYPWESREANRNVPLEEVSETFEVDVQTPKGNLKVKGSVRLRPDITRVIPFLGGVAVMANDITDLIKSEVISYVAEKDTIEAALSSVADLTIKLTKKFGENTSEFEKRFGVSVGDVTISEMLPSEALQKTMTGRSEAEIIAVGTATILGYTIKEMKAALKKGTISQADINAARDRFMAASDNIQMNLNTNEYNIRLDGADKETLRDLAKNAPAVAAVLSQQKKGK